CKRTDRTMRDLPRVEAEFPHAGRRIPARDRFAPDFSAGGSEIRTIGPAVKAPRHAGFTICCTALPTPAGARERDTCVAPGDRTREFVSIAHQRNLVAKATGGAPKCCDIFCSVSGSGRTERCRRAAAAIIRSLAASW